jgi:hypothetical protein
MYVMMTRVCRLHIYHTPLIVQLRHLIAATPLCQFASWKRSRLFLIGILVNFIKLDFFGKACPLYLEALAHQTRPSLTSSFGQAVTKHFLAGSTSAQPLLRLHRHGSVLTSSAHPCAQAPSKCCSGCSPSPHPCSVPVLGPYHDWIPAPCPYLPSHEFDQLYVILCQDPIWGPQGPKTCQLREIRHNLSVAYLFFYL